MEIRRQVLSKVLLASLLTLVLVYFVALLGLSSANKRALDAEARSRADVVALRSDVSALETAVAGASSDAAVEEWAREERSWARDGDQVVVPVPPTAEPPSAASPPTRERGGAFDRLLRWLRGG